MVITPGQRYPASSIGPAIIITGRPENTTNAAAYHTNLCVATLLFVRGTSAHARPVSRQMGKPNGATTMSIVTAPTLSRKPADTHGGGSSSSVLALRRTRSLLI
jgi:hypothetical protein